MVQVLTGVSVLTLLGLLAWGYAEHWVKWWHRGVRSLGLQPATGLEELERPIYKAPARDFLHGVADLTFGLVILGLGFFMLMWIIATG